jgi:hypothetical protein
VNRALLVSSLWLPLAVIAVPLSAQAPRQASRASVGAAEREASRLQINIMEDAFQRAVEAAHAHAIDALQVAAGMPAMFTFDGNSRARGFRLEGYGVFFDVDLPPIPRSVEWQVRVLDAGAVLGPEVDQLRQELARLKDPRATQALEPILRAMQAKVSGGGAGAPVGDGVNPTLVGATTTAAQEDPFRGYVNELKKTLLQVMLEYGPTVRLGADDWLHVAAREMSPKLMPGNPTEATITLRVKASDLAAFKAGRLTPDEAVRRVEVREVF